MNVIERLVAKVKEFKQASAHIANKHKDISSYQNPSEDLIKLMEKNSKITQELFEIVDEIETIEGKVQGDLQYR